MGYLSLPTTGTAGLVTSNGMLTEGLLLQPKPPQSSLRQAWSRELGFMASL